ncbi:DUF6734 family protein [Bacteroides bouchesdurhonensis]|uniref:DUF6734 family protein n=1 Tax=Bacteroides bouchesdurhonensis TaxID=1841855 RepID=UPI00097F83AE|nr:DUF6734 family protein [Bacteroides bouchesdurhonensis]
MRIVQTFWTANNSLLENGFGWPHPQYHLMSWALSCLSLRENYNNVVFYTDSNGYKVFIELLKLPYTDVVVQYDDLSCPDIHWAYPKIFTYSLQKEPFIHVDGDIHLPCRLDASIESGALIAQNIEMGTQYYKNMMNDLLRRDYRMPEFLHKVLERDVIPSYNAGFLGGNDLDFIQEYCRIAFQFIDDNGLLDFHSRNLSVNNNLLFEQTLFAALAEERGKKVTSVLDMVVPDNGYDYFRFCDFYRFEEVKFLHLLGGHKRNLRICELLGKTLLNRYPEYYKRIVELFPQNNKRLGNVKQTPPDMTIQKCIALYQDYLCDRIAEWKELPNTMLYDWEKRLSAYPRFINADRERQSACIIGKNPYASVFEIPHSWLDLAKHLLKERVSRERCGRSADVVCAPCLLGEGYKEALLSDWGYNMLALLDKEMSFGELLSELRTSLSSDIRNNEEGGYRSVLAELEYLCYNGIVYIKSEK